MSPLEKFQKENGLLPDGKIGKNTLGAMRVVFNICDPAWLAHYVGQLAHESQYFTREWENLNYSYERLLQIFSHDFDQDRNRILSEAEKQVARILAGKPEQIANFVYANQNGNGPEASGDGWLFRGRGPIMITGRKNYQLFADYVGDQEIMKNPDLIISKYYWQSAYWYFESNNLWRLCNVVDHSSIKRLTKAINGGYNNLQHRIELTEKYYKILLKS